MRFDLCLRGSCILSNWYFWLWRQSLTHSRVSFFVGKSSIPDHGMRRGDRLGESGLNFINILRTAFTLADPKSVKRYWRLDWVLTLLGSTRIKAVRRTLMKLTPGRARREVDDANFISEDIFIVVKFGNLNVTSFLCNVFVIPISRSYKFSLTPSSQ